MIDWIKNLFKKKETASITEKTSVSCETRRPRIIKNYPFEKSVNFVLEQEGGYVNNPKDPGGETKFGISKRSFPDLDIKNLTIDNAKSIYFDNYWKPLKCDEMEWPLNLIVFDTGVNCGVSRAKSLLLPSGLNPSKYLDEREAYYRGLNNRYFLKGWLNRLARLRKEAGL